MCRQVTTAFQQALQDASRRCRGARDNSTSSRLHVLLFAMLAAARRPARAAGARRANRGWLAYRLLKRLIRYAAARRRSWRPAGSPAGISSPRLQAVDKEATKARATSSSPAKWCCPGDDKTDRPAWRSGMADAQVAEAITHAIQVLQRRTKNNPVLIGEPGVGKTAIVEGPAPAHRQRRSARKARGQKACWC